MTPMALTCLWKSKWKSSSCSHFAKHVDICTFSCSTYSSRGVMKFHFKICRERRKRSKQRSQHSWPEPFWKVWARPRYLQLLLLFDPLLLGVGDEREERTRPVLLVFDVLGRGLLTGWTLAGHRKSVHGSNVRRLNLIFFLFLFSSTAPFKDCEVPMPLCTLADECAGRC